MKQEIEEPIEGVSIERYAGIAARLDVQAPSSATTATASARAAVLAAEVIEPALWERVHAAWQARIHEEIGRASCLPGVPVAERYPVVMRYGAAYAKAKRSLEAQRPVDADAEKQAV
jgi:acyl-coenzyme A synthetase/AMP-(fatty) acid ligase